MTLWRVCVCVFAHAYAYGTNTQRREINKTTRELSADSRRGSRETPATVCARAHTNTQEAGHD